MDKSTADDYIEDLLEERARLFEEIRTLKAELERTNALYADSVLERNHHIIDNVQRN